jgi:glycosyltransferase involved in cell wall biosynthesis
MIKMMHVVGNLRQLEVDYFSPDHLDLSLNGNWGQEPISAIIPTYNRSQFPVEENSNPLGWTLNSLKKQRRSFLEEVVIVDDSSDDYTEQVVKNFGNEFDGKVTYVKNEERLGSSRSRNVGVQNSSNDLLMFLDDDCLFSPYMLFGAEFTMNHLGGEFGALHLPVYHRDDRPRELIDRQYIGLLDLVNGTLAGNFGRFPRNYILGGNLEEQIFDSKSFLNQDLGIFNPFEISNIGGIFMIRKDIFNGVGGFPENLPWSNGYREETVFSMKLSDKGYKIGFTPDPKFHCVHLKYGSTKEGGNGTDKNGLTPYIAASNVSRNQSGNRVDLEGWFHDYLLSTAVVLQSRSEPAALNFLEQMKKRFVETNDLAVTGTRAKIYDQDTRQRIYSNIVSEREKYRDLV